MAPTKTAQPVTVSLNDLKSGTVPFSSLLEAFGPDSLGILVVKDLPSQFPTLRTSVLSNSSRLATLPEDKLSKLVNPQAKYLVGWSHGVETLKPGVVDTAKGSYYINGSFYQDPSLEAADAAKYPGFEEHTAPNLWPSDADIPNFKTDAKSLINLIIDVAILVARACDQYASNAIPDYKPNYLEHVVKTSTTTKARLLHYFPTSPTPPRSTSSASDSDEINDDWCATHLDHGCLTGLTSAMFLDESTSTLSELPSSPSPSAGLYIRSRGNETYKVSIPRDALAFQTGETLELITQGKFKAVPHFVRGVDLNELEKEGKSGMKVARNTLAVFTQPNLGEVVDTSTGQTFGEFARGVVGRNTAR
jgi:isopenicillin N synthase-like dioxygenase